MSKYVKPKPTHLRNLLRPVLRIMCSQKPHTTKSKPTTKKSTRRRHGQLVPIHIRNEKHVPNILAIPPKTNRPRLHMQNRRRTTRLQNPSMRQTKKHRNLHTMQRIPMQAHPKPSRTLPNHNPRRKTPTKNQPRKMG